MGSSGGKSPSIGAKNVKRLHIASGSKSAKKPTESLSSGNDNIVVDLLQMEVLWVRFVI